jgi:putative methyltransferase (TIGR04325 family)
MVMPYKDLIPPVLVKVAKAARAALHNSSAQHRTFASYKEAAAECKEFGYEKAELVDIVFQKTAIYRNNCDLKNTQNLTIAETLALFALGLGYDRRKINVIDFGGACGAHFFRMRAFLNREVTLRWHVVDTPAMVRRAKEFSNFELEFFDSLGAAVASFEQIDVIFSSGTLQYAYDPLKTLADLLACNSRYVALARLALGAGDSSIVEIQESRLSENGPGPLPPGFKDGISRYPVTFASENRIESILRERYRILLRIPDASVGADDNCVSGLGYVAERKTSI